MEIFVGGLVTGGMNAARRRTQGSPMVQEGYFPNKASPNQALVLIQHHHCVALDSSPTSGWHQDLFCASFRSITHRKVVFNWHRCPFVAPTGSAGRCFPHRVVKGEWNMGFWGLQNGLWILRVVGSYENHESLSFFICHMEMITLEVIKRLKEKTENTQHIVASSFD